MEALITKIPINVRYGRQVKYLKSTLPEALRAMSGELSGTRIATELKPSGDKPTKSGTPRKKTKRKLVMVTRNVTHPWWHRLHPQNLKTK